MSVAGLDHLAITVADISRTVDFYCRVLGAQDVYGDLWRSGKIPIAILQLGESRLSVHASAAPASPHAEKPTSGSGDICFRWRGSLDAAASMLEGHDVAIVEGPVDRPAADGTLGKSIYFRDPDGNLLELLSTDEA